MCHIYVDSGHAYTYRQTSAFVDAASKPGFPFRKLGSGDSPQAGDVVVYPGHMSIYAGDGQVWSAHKTGYSYDEFPVKYFGTPSGYYRYQYPPGQ